MATSTTITWRQVYRAGTILVFVAAIGLGILMLGTPTAQGATADLTLGNLTVDGVNRTVSGNVTDVTLTATLDYSFEVPDATQRVVKIQAGADTSSLSTVDYAVQMDPSGTASGTVTLSGSVLSATTLTASDVDPTVASTETTEFVVRAVIEVTRDNGETVTATVTDTVTVTVTDGTELSAQVGGTGNVTVQTDA